MQKRTLGIFFSTAIVSAALFATTPVDAAWTVRRSSTSCIAGGGVSHWGNVGNNTSNSVYLALTCDVLSESDKPHTAITVFNVHVDKPGSQFANAGRCVRLFNASGAACGDFHARTTSGTITLNPPMTPAGFVPFWNALVHFPYLVVNLPPGAGLKGYYTEAP